MGSSGLKARARAGVDRGVLGPCCRRVGGVAGVRDPRCVGGVRAFDGEGVRAWRPVLAGGAAPVLDCWRSRNGVRGGSIVARLGVKAVPRRAVGCREVVKLRSVLAAWQLLLLIRCLYDAPRTIYLSFLSIFDFRRGVHASVSIER